MLHKKTQNWQYYYKSNFFYYFLHKRINKYNKKHSSVV